MSSHALVCVQVKGHLERESLLSFHHVGPGLNPGHQLGSRCLYPLNYTPVQITLLRTPNQRDFYVLSNMPRENDNDIVFLLSKRCKL